MTVRAAEKCWGKGWRKGWGKGSGKGWGKDKVDPPAQATAQTLVTAGASAAAAEELHASGQVLFAESASGPEPDPEPEEEPEAEPDSCAWQNSDKFLAIITDNIDIRHR